METPYKASDGTKQVFLDVYEQKITPRSTYHNSFLANLIMPSDYGTGDFASMSAAAHKTSRSSEKVSKSIHFILILRVATHIELLY